MKGQQATPQTIDAYIAACPSDVQERLEQVRATIRQAAPEAEETISYQMPTFKLHGHYLVYFAAFKKHIGFYPAPIGVAEFQAELAPYATGKGSVQFPYDRPIPFELITRIVNFRMQENLARAAGAKKK
jgi:uncharacterized protein YdhG (YjbR/CyaY superfamily)